MPRQLAARAPSGTRPPATQMHAQGPPPPQGTTSVPRQGSRQGALRPVCQGRPLAGGQAGGRGARQGVGPPLSLGRAAPCSSPVSTTLQPKEWPPGPFAITDRRRWGGRDTSRLAPASPSLCHSVAAQPTAMHATYGGGRNGMLLAMLDSDGGDSDEKRTMTPC